MGDEHPAGLQRILLAPGGDRKGEQTFANERGEKTRKKASYVLCPLVTYGDDRPARINLQVKRKK